MDIIRSANRKQLNAFRTDYIKRVVARFNMDESKPAITYLALPCKLEDNMKLASNDEKDRMSHVPCMNTNYLFT